MLLVLTQKTNLQHYIAQTKTTSMITSSIIYKGNLRTQATHIGSGSDITTDAPLDNNGKGAYFSPTDLVATALGSCALTIMGIAAEKHGITLEHCDLSVVKTMSAAPRKISAVDIVFDISGKFTKKEMTILEKAAKTCPVALSLHPDLKQNITFNWPA